MRIAKLQTSVKCRTKAIVQALLVFSPYAHCIRRGRHAKEVQSIFQQDAPQADCRCDTLTAVSFFSVDMIVNRIKGQDCWWCLDLSIPFRLQNSWQRVMDEIYRKQTDINWVPPELTQRTPHALFYTPRSKYKMVRTVWTAVKVWRGRRSEVVTCVHQLGFLIFKISMSFSQHFRCLLLSSLVSRFLYRASLVVLPRVWSSIVQTYPKKYQVSAAFFSRVCCCGKVVVVVLKRPFSQHVSLSNRLIDHLS